MPFSGDRLSVMLSEEPSYTLTTTLKPLKTAGVTSENQDSATSQPAASSLFLASGWTRWLIPASSKATKRTDFINYLF